MLPNEINYESEIIKNTNAEFTWLSGDDMANNCKAPEFLINDILETNSHGLISGSSQAFKTFCVIKMAHSVCTGNDFFGHEVFTTGKVLYICGEGLGALSRRIKAIKIVEGDFNGNLFVLDQPLGIDDERCMDWLRESINHIKPMLVIADTFSSLATQTDENDNSQVARTIKMISGACENEKTSSIVIHHHGKDTTKGSRGASAFTANMDFSFSMTREGDSMQAVFSCKKMKDSANFEEINLIANIVELGMIRQDGRETSSIILKRSDNDNLPTNQQKSLDAIKTAIIENGVDMNDGRICIDEAQMRKCLAKAFKDTSNKFKAFGECLPPLIAKDIIKTCGAYYWI